MRLPGAFPPFRTSISFLAFLSLLTLPAAAQQVVLSPANVHFGKVAVGRRNVRTVTVTNWSGATVRFEQAIARGSGFTLEGFDLPLVLARGQSFTFSTIFSPEIAGEARGSILFASEGSTGAKPALMLELAGVGTSGTQLDAEPPTINFGNVLLGTFASQPGKLTAIGTAVTISSVDISDPEFTVSGLSFPVTIPAGGSQDYTVQFAPQMGGPVSGTVSFLTDVANSVAVQSLLGSGQVQEPHSVDLSWNASSSQDVIGYNIYRGTTSGGPYSKMNSALDTNTDYTDMTVLNGNTYYYVATAVDSNNQESVYSNEAQAIIPGQDRAIDRSTPGSSLRPRIATRYSSTRTRR